MNKIWEWIKKWWLGLVGIIVALIAAGRKPKWIKVKEKEIKERDREIEQSKKDLGKLTKEYGEVKKEHDANIERAKEVKDNPAYPDPDDAAEYIDGVLRKIKGE